MDSSESVDGFLGICKWIPDQKAYDTLFSLTIAILIRG